MPELEEETVWWLAGKPGWQNKRERLAGSNRDEVAQRYARQHYSQDAVIAHEGRGSYSVTYPGYFGHPYLERSAFQVKRAPDQARRGQDEAKARSALMGLFGAGWAIPEASLSKQHGWTSERADLLLLPDQGGSVGIEIKTERDNLTRLAQQIPCYQEVYQRCLLATTMRHMEAALAILPPHWGVVELGTPEHQIVRVVRESVPAPLDPFLPHLLIRELWSNELVQLLSDAGLRKHGTHAEKIERLLEALDPAELRKLTLETLARREGARVQARRISMV